MKYESPLAILLQPERCALLQTTNILSEQELDQMEIWAEKLMTQRQEPRKPPETWKALCQLVTAYNIDLNELQHADNDLAERMTPRRVAWFSQVMRWSVLIRADILASPVFSWADWREGELTSAQDRLSDVGANDLRFIERV